VIPVIILFGPTASGKTSVLFKLLTTDFPGMAEVISADSMQVYRGMDIGTAKPSKKDREKLPVHLIDIRNPDEQFNAGDFVRLAEETCVDIHKRGKIPVISGGTGFYIKNFIFGLPEAPPSDSQIRIQLQKKLAEHGPKALMGELSLGDPVSAQRIHINDTYRLLRALEVLRLCGKPLSSFAVSGKNTENSENAKFRFLILAINRNRSDLYKRINERCRNMFVNGLPDEVKSLCNAGYTPKDPGLRAIGYREFFYKTDDGSFKISNDYAAVEDLVAKNTRNYAKRQITFFSRMPGVKWISADNGENAVVQQIHIDIKNFLKL